MHAASTSFSVPEIYCFLVDCIGSLTEDSVLEELVTSSKLCQPCAQGLRSLYVNMSSCSLILCIQCKGQRPGYRPASVLDRYMLVGGSWCTVVDGYLEREHSYLSK